MTFRDSPELDFPKGTVLLDSELLARHGRGEAPSATSSGVVVTIKRRRGVAEPVDKDNRSQTGPDGVPGDGNRPPRVFRVGSSSTHPASTDVEAGPAHEDGVMRTSGAANTSPTAVSLRRRRVTDPSRAPGKVTSVVFSTPAVEPTPLAKSSESVSNGSFVVNVDRYSRAFAELEAVRETVQLAMRARGFRIL